MKTLKWMIILLLSVGILVGCGDKEKAGNKDNVKPTSSQNHGESKKSGKDDQLDLHIGDTGTVKTEYQGTFKVTLNSVEMAQDLITGESPNEAVIVAHVSVENIGKTDIKGDETARIIDILDFKDGSKSSAAEVAAQFPSISDPLSKQGIIKPGKSVEGDIAFDTYKAEKYQIMFGYSNSLMNQVVWTFTPDEAK